MTQSNDLPARDLLERIGRLERLLDGLETPCRGIIGPWAHQYPHAGRPGPAIGFLQEAVRWWDHWLNGRDRGVMREPKLRVWLQQHCEPQPQVWPGEWLGTDLDRAEFESIELYLVDDALRTTPGSAARAAPRRETASDL